MSNKQDKGFTLVELLIVIVILGILATVTVFAVRGITDQGQDNACAVEKRTIETAIEAFYADNNAAPADSAATAPYGGFAVLGNGAYLQDAPADLAERWEFTTDTTANQTTVAGVAASDCDGF
jgi:prepilin-type N-terminal cleavage/methylation domain-containing protein